MDAAQRPTDHGVGWLDALVLLVSNLPKSDGANAAIKADNRCYVNSENANPLVCTAQIERFKRCKKVNDFAIHFCEVYGPG